MTLKYFVPAETLRLPFLPPTIILQVENSFTQLLPIRLPIGVL